MYHLLLLWAVVAGLGMAWGEWRRARHEHAQRLFIAMAGIVLFRAVYAIAGLLAGMGWGDEVILLPPLERFADAASIGLLAWAFMPSVRRTVRLWNLIFAGILALALGTLVATTLLWAQAYTFNPSLNFNGQWQSNAWVLEQIGVLVLAMAAVVRRQRRGWGTFTSAFAVILIGTLVQFFYPTAAMHLPLWQRLANLVAYPLIAVAVYQDIVTELHIQSRELQDISQASLDQIKSLLHLFEASQQTSQSLDLSQVLDNAVRGIARVLDADQCAIAFPEEGNAGRMRLVAIYNPTRQGRGEAVAFPLEYQLTVQQAIRRRKYLIVEDADNVQLKVLFALLGSAETGPLLVQPLVGEQDVIGAIIVGNARSRRPFTANEAKLCQSMAEQTVRAIRNAQQYEEAQDKIDELRKAHAERNRALQQARAQLQDMSARLVEVEAQTEISQDREEAAREARNALEIQLASRRAELDTLSQRLAVLETDLAQAHADSEARLRWHEQEVGRQESEWQDLVRAAESIQLVLQGLTAGVLITDADGRIEEANVAAGILLDLSAEELQGLVLSEISDDDRWQQAVRIASGGEAVRVTLRIGINTLMCDVAPLPDFRVPRDEGQRLVAIIQDISAEAEEQRARLEGIAILAEELRTPITTINSYSDLLLGEAVGILGELQRKFLLRMKAGADRMAQMVNDLTREAGGEEQWSRPHRQRVDVIKLIEATIASSHTQLEDKALTVDLEMPEELPPVKADPDYLRRVLSNLLSNACLASSVGGHIQVQTLQSQTVPPDRGPELNGDKFVIVSVKDSGGGLSEEALSRVFDRSRPSQTPPGLGESGAGLALVKRLVEAHGGRLWVESERGVGTTFSFVLPVDSSENHADEREEASVI
ncbi:MAG: ATP-binding protein [Anaerolineae bacterium]|nr:ATP-binding protein [Anaerolineae bacterium]